MFNRYVMKLIFRCLIFVSCIIIYIADSSIMDLVFTKQLHRQLFYMYIIWAIMMVGMAMQLIPNRFRNITMGCMKHHKVLYKPTNEHYDVSELKHYIRISDRGATKVLVSWLLLTAVIGILFFTHVIDQKILLVLTLFFYVCDIICVTLWCPFQTFMMENKCCVNCRIFNWGYAMMFTPMLFIPSFFSWSLLGMSILIVVVWEITWHRHPERFWFRTNASLQCRNCTDKICAIKKPLKKNPYMVEGGKH